MIARSALVALWLAMGSTFFAALYWAFLNTPESNTLMLALSMALIVGMVVVLALVVNAAVLLTNGMSFRTSLATAARTMHWFVVASAPIALVWWLVLRGDGWISAHSGEIQAWFIARFGWPDVGWFFRSGLWISRWMRWVLVPLASLSLLAALLQPAAASRQRWLGRAWHWRSVALATLVFVMLMVLPWRLANWRPDLPLTWIQPAAAAARLALVVVLWSIGAALLVALAVSERTAEPRSPGTSELPNPGT